MKHLNELSDLQEQLDSLQKEKIVSFYEANKTIKTNSLISLIFSSLVAHSENMETYADLIQYYYEHMNSSNWIEKHIFRFTLVSAFHEFFFCHRMQNYLSFSVQLLERAILFPKDIKMYPNFHFAIEHPEIIRAPFYLFIYLQFPEDIKNPFLEIYKRRHFAYVNLPVANAIRNDDVELFQKITSTISEENANQDFYQKITKNGQKMTCYDITIEAIPWFDRNELISVDPVSLVQYSCFYGSIKCFKFLVANGAEIASKQLSVITTEEFAICGGCEEIIHICQQKGLDFFNENCLNRAVQFHHESLVNWILFNSKIELQKAVNLCVLHNAFSILNGILNDGEKISKIDFDETLAYLPASNQKNIDISGIKMFEILNSFIKEKQKESTEIKEENKNNTDENKKEEKPIEYLIEEVLQINTEFQDALKFDVEKFVSLFKTQENYIGSILFCVIEAGCRARPYLIKNYANVVKRVFDSIEDQKKKENEYKVFVDHARDYLAFDNSNKKAKKTLADSDNHTTNDDSNEEINEEDEEENLHKSDCFDYANKNSFICLVLHLIDNQLLKKSDFNDIDCMKEIFNDESQVLKRKNGMLNDPIAYAILSKDVESLKKLKSQIKTDDIDPEELKYDWSGFIATYGHVNWLQYSAFYCSPDCFLFLLQNVFTDPSFLQNCNTFAIIGSSGKILPLIDHKFDKSQEYFPGLLFAQRYKTITRNIEDKHYGLDEIQTIANNAFYFNNYAIILFLIRSSILEMVDLDEVALFCGKSLDMLYHHNAKYTIYYYNNGTIQSK